MLDSTGSAEISPTSSNRPRFDVQQLKRTFDDEGYVVLRGVISKPELANIQRRLAEEFDAWKKSTESFRGGGLLSGHLNCYPGAVAKGVLHELKDTGTLDLAQSLFPTDPRATRVGCNF
ncbi:MAG TPA: hypothetical protein VEQ58_07620, partial [Polyangiaceae bacterium]|nr:hypothetical protein [Polyangiaceae bacterium]